MNSFRLCRYEKNFHPFWKISSLGIEFHLRVFSFFHYFQDVVLLSWPSLCVMKMLSSLSLLLYIMCLFFLWLVFLFLFITGLVIWGWCVLMLFSSYFLWLEITEPFGSEFVVFIKLEKINHYFFKYCFHYFVCGLQLDVYQATWSCSRAHLNSVHF